MIDKVLNEDETLHFASQNADSTESSDSEQSAKLTATAFNSRRALTCK